MIEDGRTGFLPKTEGEYVAAIELLRADPALRHRVGSAARMHATDVFGSDVAAVKTEDVYERLLELPKSVRESRMRSRDRGAELFVAALGDAGACFEAALSPDDRVRADAERSLASRRVTPLELVDGYGSVFQYARYHPTSVTLWRWAALTAEAGAAVGGVDTSLDDVLELEAVDPSFRVVSGRFLDGLAITGETSNA
jgi:hypothetical protein